MLDNWKELLANRELLIIWAKRDLKVRYKQSLLGAAWAVLQPLSATVLFAVIFSHFVRVDTGGVPYPIFYYSALLPWTFFSASISFAATSLVNNMSLVTKIYFPREILPIASVAAGFVDFLIASVVFVGMMILYQVPVGLSIVLVPVVVAIQILLSLGLVLLASCTMVYYRDVRFVIPLGLQLWMYATPIIYPLDAVPERWRGLYMLNPMAGLIDSYRRIILSALWPQPLYLLSAAGVSLVLFLIAYWFFKRSEAVFADII